MYLKGNKIECVDEKYKVYERNNVFYYYTPTIFTLNTNVGLDTIKYLAKQYESERGINYIELFGAYIVIIHDRNKNELIAFTDHNGQRCLYLYNNRIADSFVKLVEGIDNIEIDYDKAVEYLYYGANHFGFTYAKDIYRSKGECYYKIDAKGTLKTEAKGIGALSDLEYSIDTESFSNMIKSKLMDSTPEARKVLTLTGGFDSRYVFSVINSESLDVALYSTIKDDPDIDISRRISNLMEKDFNVFIIDKEECLDETIRTLVIDRDVYMSLFNGMDFTYKMTKFLQILNDHKYTLLFTGDTGILHKDEHWKEELPTYNKQKTNFMKFYKNRVKPVSKVTCYTKAAIDSIEGTEQLILEWLKQNIQQVNTKSYDWYEWYLKVKAFRNTYYNTKSKILEVYAPLLEYRFVVNSYNLKRRERYSGRYMSRWITKKMPMVSRVPTVLGMTTCTDVVQIPRNTLFKFKNLCIKAIRLFSMKLFKKSFNNIQPAWTFAKDIKKTTIYKAAIRFAIEKNFIEKDSDIKLDLNTICRIIELYMFHTYICKKDSSH